MAIEKFTMVGEVRDRGLKLVGTRTRTRKIEEGRGARGIEGGSGAWKSNKEG